MKHLYIHIPFCRRRCAYCDFNTYANLEDRIEAYVAALCAELRMLGQAYAGLPCVGHLPPADPPPDALPPTIFFGGGTPSMLSLCQLEQVLAAAGELVPLAQAEVTLEANPGTVMGKDTTAAAYLAGLRALGVNRLSLGVQSLHDPTLRVLGRTHSAAEAYDCYREARRAGFDNINLDFMFGLPGQSVEQWAAALDAIVAWEVDHFALYSLILEERTPLYAQVMRGQVHVPDDDATAAMYETAIDCLGAAGYVQYEISNWARPGDQAPAANGKPAHPAWPGVRYACVHNLAYWLNSDYLAAGAGAHGHVYPRRYADLPGVDEYIRAVQAGRRPLAEVVELTPRDLYAETMFMGLRLNAGVRLDHFRRRCGIDMDEAFGDTLAELETRGLLERDAHAVRLTARGRMLGNQVFERFV